MSKISIIVPVYNVGKYVEKTILSVLNQTYKDFELIIIDDGSTDESGEICDRLTCNDNRVKVIHQKNAGVSVARNVGMAEATGEWITFLDGDDYLDENYLDEMYKGTKTGDYQIVLCSYYYVNDEKVGAYSFFNENRFFSKKDRELLIKTALGEELPKDRKVTTGGPVLKLFKREYLINNGFHFVPGLKKTQDVIFMIDCYSKIDSMYYLDKPLYYYVKRNDSAVNAYHEDQEQTSLQIMHYLKLFFDRNSWIIDAKELYNSRVIVLILDAFKLKYTKKACNMSVLSKMKEIKKLCENMLCKEALESRRYYKLSRKLSVFEFFLHRRMYFSAYLLCKIKYGS